MRFLLGLWMGTKMAGETVRSGGLFTTILFLLLVVFVVEHAVIIIEILLWILLVVILYYNRFRIKWLFTKLATILNKNSSMEDPH